MERSVAYTEEGIGKVKALIEAGVARVKATRSLVLTDFLDEHEVVQAQSALDIIGEVKFRVYGGYKGASRARIALMPPYYPNEAVDPDIGYFHIAFHGPADSMAHMVAAGIRGAGISLDEVGDVFPTDDGFQGVATRTGISSLVSGPVVIDGIPCPVSEIDWAELTFPGQRVKDIKTTVASLRLDSISGAGFAASRTRMAQEISLGRVKVNGKMVSSPAARLDQGDAVIARGRGRIVLAEVVGTTKRDRISIVIKKYSPM